MVDKVNQSISSLPTPPVVRVNPHIPRSIHLYGKNGIKRVHIIETTICIFRQTLQYDNKADFYHSGGQGRKKGSLLAAFSNYASGAASGEGFP